MRQSFRVRVLCLVVVAFAFLLPAGDAFAATATTTFQVTASVLKACVVSATALSFGTYNPVGGTSLAGTATVSTTCTNGTTYTVALSSGASTGATVTTRKMTGQGSSSNLLSYGLFQDSMHTVNWGNTPGTDTPATATGNGLTAQALTVYGLIPASTSAAIDTYVDTITITVAY